MKSLISLSLLLTLLTVILSAYIRLAEVGIGCDNWPSCYAQLDTRVEGKGITVLTEEGRNMAHYGARIAHRYIASTLGLFVVAIFILALRQGRSRATGLMVPTTIFAVTVFLSLLGYYTPTRSNPLITMGNLLGGMSLLGLLWWFMQREAGSEARDAAPGISRYRPLAMLALALVAMQIVLGGWSSANYASTQCPGLIQCNQSELALRTMGEAFNPFRRVELDSGGKVVMPGHLAALAMAHRLFALITAAYLAWLVRKLKPEPALAGTVLALSIFSIGQLVLGVSMIWLQLPLLLVTLHNAFAAGLMLSSINLLHRLTQPARSPLPGQEHRHPPD
ncbi:MAG: COX15/CtaA family protein [Halioglobus sp.]